MCSARQWQGLGLVGFVAAVVLVALGALSCGGGSPTAASPPAPTCTAFTYSDWGACQPSGIKTRTVLTSSPAGCAGGSPTLTETCTYVPPGTRLNLQIVKYNNLEGPQGSLSRTVEYGSSLDICVPELGLSGIDPSRIVLRESNPGRLGRYLAFGANGCAGFKPEKDQSVDAYTFDTRSRADYARIDNNPYRKHEMYQRSMTAYATGNVGSLESQAFENLISSFNSALNPPWTSYGGITTSQGSGDIQISFNTGTSFCGSHTTLPPWRIFMETSLCQAIPRNIQGVMVEELFEVLTQTVDIDGNGSHVIKDDSRLADIGRAYLTYVYIKDAKD